MPKRLETRLQALEQSRRVTALPVHNIFITACPDDPDTIIAFACDAKRIDRLPNESLGDLEARAGQSCPPDAVTLWCPVYALPKAKTC